MRKSRTTTIAHIRLRKKVNPQPHFLAILEQIKSLLLPYARSLELRVNTPVHYELWTRELVRTTSGYYRYRNMKLLFASVVVYDRHVALYFHPIYLDKTLADHLPPELKESLTGVTAFHFYDLNDSILEALKNLIRAGWDSYKKIRAVV